MNSTRDAGLAHKRPARIYLNGFMGSGKSTVGPVLAAQMGWQFADLDEAIVNVLQMPIAAFFEQEGEAAFREVERDVLHKTAALQDCVVALGGGALCSTENLSWALANGLVVYLQTSAAELMRRLMPEQASRPMLHGPQGELLDEAAVQRRISDLLAKRMSLYEQAHLVLETDGRTVDEIVNALQQVMYQQG